MNRIEYVQLASAQIQKDRKLVISSCSKGGFTIAQKLKVTEQSGHQIDIFLKNAVHIDDIEGLYELRDALNEVISKCDEFKKS